MIKIFTGRKATDERGSVSFVNDFEFEGVRRCYWIRNHQQGFVRAWHGHISEAKYITVITGTALVAAVQIDNWVKPSKDCPVVRYTISADHPQVLYIPAGFANGVKTLTADAVVLVFSTATVMASAYDDIRFPARYWDCWGVDER